MMLRINFKAVFPALMMGVLAASTLAIAAPQKNRDDRGGSRVPASAEPRVVGGGDIKVYSKKAETCLAPLTASLQDVLPQTINLSKKSHLLVMFTGEFQGVDATQQGHIQFRLDATSEVGNGTWDFPGDTSEIVTGTVSWLIPNVPAGNHTVAAEAFVHGGDGSDELNDCSLSIFVLPRL